MKLVAMCVRDQAIESFGTPFFVTHQGAGLRSFIDEVNRQSDDNQLNKHPDDFVLYRCGEFDQETGIFTPLNIPERVAQASDVVVRPE